MWKLSRYFELSSLTLVNFFSVGLSFLRQINFAVAARILYRVFVAKSVGYLDFRRLLLERFGPGLLLSDALSAIRLMHQPAEAKRPFVVNLGVDEFQKLLADGQSGISSL